MFFLFVLTPLLSAVMAKKCYHLLLQPALTQRLCAIQIQIRCTDICIISWWNPSQLSDHPIQKTRNPCGIPIQGRTSFLMPVRLCCRFLLLGMKCTKIILNFGFESMFHFCDLQTRLHAGAEASVFISHRHLHVQCISDTFSAADIFNDLNWRLCLKVKPKQSSINAGQNEKGAYIQVHWHSPVVKSRWEMLR